MWGINWVHVFKLQENAIIVNKTFHGEGGRQMYSMTSYRRVYSTDYHTAGQVTFHHTHTHIPHTPHRTWNHHHHTVQVATIKVLICTCVHISNCLVGREKTPPAQVTAGDGGMVVKVRCAHYSTKRASWPRKHHQCKSQAMPTDGRKNTTSTSCRGSRPSWALVGAGCSN